MTHDTQVEPPEFASLRARSAALLDELATTAGSRIGGARRLVGLPALIVQLRRIAPTATTSAWVMQPQYTYDPEDPGVALTRAARMRGVDTELITRPATVSTHPLLSSIFPGTLLGPVFLRALVIDRRHALIGGPDDALGERTSWYVTLPEVVGAVVDLWEDTVPLCSPILPPDEAPPLTERQLEVAKLVCVGREDHEIAQQLSVDLAEVRRETGALFEVLGARTRTEAVLVMRGRGVNGGWTRSHP